jgi:hypothetical protein
MKRKAIYLIDKEELATLSTKMLLVRLKSLLQCESSPELSDQEKGLSVNANQIQFKNTEQWISAHKNVKAELTKREHSPKGKELEAIRLDKHKLQKTTDRKIKVKSFRSSS